MLKFNKGVVFLLLLCMLMASFGCNVKTKNLGKSQSVTPSVVVTPSGVVTTPQVTTVTPGGIIKTKPKVSAIVKAFENNTLLTIKYLNSVKWKSVDSKITTLKKELKVLIPSLKKEGVTTAVTNGITTSVDSLASNAKGKKAYDAKLNANEILRYLGDARSNYTTTFPLDLLRLNYYLRDIQYSAEEKNFTKATEDLNFINPIWKSIMSNMSSSDKNITNMNTAIKDIQKYISAKNIKKVIIKTDSALNISTSIEKMFEKKGKSI